MYSPFLDNLLQSQNLPLPLFPTCVKRLLSIGPSVLVSGPGLEVRFYKEPQEGLNSVIGEFNPDMVIISGDLPFIKPYIASLKRCFKGKIVCYLEMSYYSINRGYLNMLNTEVNTIFVGAKFWKNNLETQGVSTDIKVVYLERQKRVLMDKTDARRIVGLSNDCFIFLCPLKNDCRNRHDLLIMAFAKLISKHPNRSMGLFCLAGSSSQLLDIFSTEMNKHNLGVEQHIGKLLFTQMDEENIDTIYNCSDVGVYCAESEGGFNSTVDILGLGKPSILPESNLAEELFQGNSLTLQIKHSGYSSYGAAYTVSVEDLVEAMEKYLLQPSLVEKHGLSGLAKIREFSTLGSDEFYALL